MEKNDPVPTIVILYDKKWARNISMIKFKKVFLTSKARSVRFFFHFLKIYFIQSMKLGSFVISIDIF